MIIIRRRRRHGVRTYTRWRDVTATRLGISAPSLLQLFRRLCLKLRIDAWRARDNLFSYWQASSNALQRLQGLSEFRPISSYNYNNWLIFVSHLLALILVLPPIFSERELKFMFAICRRPSVCLSVCLSSVICRLSVTFVHPTQAIDIFGNIFTPFCRLVIYELSVKILRRSSQGNPSIWG